MKQNRMLYLHLLYSPLLFVWLFLPTNLFAWQQIILPDTTNSPQPVMYLRMNPYLDRMSPRHDFSGAGVAFARDRLIGVGRHNWIVAKSLDNEVLWVLPNAHDVVIPPQVVGEHVYVAIRSGEVLKVRIATGELLWRAKLNSHASRPMSFTSKVLVVATAGRYVYALATDTGKTKWLYDVGSGAEVTLLGGAPPLLAKEKVYFGDVLGNVSLLSLQTGKLQEKYPLVSEGRFKDIVGALHLHEHQRLFFTAASGKIGAVDLKRKQKKPAWQRKFHSISTSLCTKNLVCYVAIGSGELVAVDLAKEGESLWHKVLGWHVAALTLHDTHLYASGVEGFITKLHLTSGKTVWQENLDGSITNPATVFRGMIFFITGKQNIYGFRL